MRCGALLLAVQCGYAILRAVLVRFLQFGEHPYWSLSQRRTCEVSSGGTSSASTGSLESWFQITENNSTTTRSEIFAYNWESRITTPHPPTLRPTDRLRLRTDLCLRSSRFSSRGQRVYVQKSCQVYYGCIG